ncbi:hypothetical protein [Brevibacillus thermoruber]|uniref:hypothetical protein n=1 Tax=Brevibacillus thermoruber TaxID=33942 RepID=UPI000559A0C1|nr:hypothetical protein [Brevibacillus thermoruber]
MAMPEDKKPIYDERVKEILQGLAEGKTRDELAVAFGHKNYKTLDIYMRRKNFTWDRLKQTYVPAFSRIDAEAIIAGPAPSTKVANVLSFFEKEDADPRVIAKQLGFSDHRELANYMRGKGYEWSTEKKNYVRKVGIVEKTEAAAVEGKDAEVADGGAVASNRQVDSVGYVMEKGTSDLGRFLPLLEMLEKHKDRLFGLILPGSDGGRVPRYVVPGVLMTKSVHMPNTLDNLVKEYAREKNISQRDIFQVALIDFFRRYGYEREIDTLLGGS